MKLRFCIAIPTFNNPKTIATVVQECLTLTPYPVIVIDDGSTPKIELAPHARLTLVRHDKNFGKGHAIQTAFRLALQDGYTHVLTLDGDAQHLISEVEKVIAEAHKHPWHLVIGERIMSGAHVPEISRVGRRISNYWVKFETHKAIRDSQSGFRIYPIFHVQSMQFWTKRFDFEIEILIRLMWKGVNVREVIVDVYYPPPEERVSHFHKIWDNTRITLLNMVLIAISLIRVPESAFRIALSIAIGVAVGVTPFFGFHTLIIGGVAFAFRLNFIALLIGSQISLPPLAPVLFWAARHIAHYLPFDSEWASMAFAYLILSLVCAVSVFLLVLGVLSHVRSNAKSKARGWTGGTRGGKIGYAIMRWALHAGGLKVAYILIIPAIPYFYFFAPKARKSLSQYWKNLNPDLGFFRRQLKIFGHFYTFAKVLIDRAFQEHLSHLHFPIKTDGIENLTEAQATGRGLVMLSAHVGAWDFASFVLKKKSHSTQFHVVKFEADGLTYDKASGKTAGGQAHYLSYRSSEASGLVFQVRELLEKGASIGFMGDRPVGNQIELVLFMGKLCLWDTTALRIAKICKVPVISAFAFKSEDSSYDFYASTAVEVSDVYEAACEFSRNLETLLRKYPDQWFNFFPFWSVTLT